MKYALNLSEKDSGRVLSVTFDKYAPAWQPRVEELPEGNINDYTYDVMTGFHYDPLPVPEVDPEDEIPLEQKVADLEAALLELAELLGGQE